jgi:hypothetical protein
MDKVTTAISIFDVDSDNGQDCCSEFKAGASMEEGVAGRKKIDTTFENTSEDIVDAPRSDRGGVATADQPAPRPMDLYKFPHRRL